MKIVLNVKKKHLIFFGLFLIFAGGIFVIAQGGQYGGGTPSSGVGHPDLYADYISSWTESKSIQVNDPQGISFRIGDNPDLYSIRATSNAIRYGDDSTSNVFEGKICSSYTDGRNNNCISINDLINNNRFMVFRGEEINIGRKRLVGQLHETDPGLPYRGGPRNIQNLFDPNVGKRTAKGFCLTKSYAKADEFTSISCPTPDTPTAYNKEGNGETTFDMINSGCIEIPPIGSVYGIIDYVKCVGG